MLYDPEAAFRGIREGIAGVIIDAQTRPPIRHTERTIRRSPGEIRRTLDRALTASAARRARKNPTD